MDFPPEQQGKLMHYFVRKELLGTQRITPWEKFADWVRSHPQAA
jgi:hypothetical protein